jgi:hypothetical protein
MKFNSLKEVSIMARGRGNATKWTTGRVFMVGVALMFTALFIFGGPLQFLYDNYGPDWMRTKPGDLPDDSQPVDLSVGLWVDLHDIVPGTAVPVDIYDANKILIETRNSDTTTGIASFQFDFWEGETVFVQAYVAGNAATGLTYMSPLLEFVVPDGDVNGDAQLATIHLQEPSSSTAAPTILAWNQAGHAITGTGETTCLNTTDTAMTILINTVTASTYFGLPTDVHDQRLDFDYKKGLFLRIVTNGSVPFASPQWAWSEGTTFYYVWNVAGIANTAADPADGTLSIILPSTSTFDFGGAAGANLTMSIDLFDWVRVISGDIKSVLSYMDFDTSNTVAAITTYLHT